MAKNTFAVEVTFNIGLVMLPRDSGPKLAVGQ